MRNFRNWILNNKDLVKWISSGMVVIIIVSIFLFSAQGRESEELSGAIADKVMEIDLFDFSVFSAVSSGKVPASLFVHQLVRKLAHVFIFALLGFFLRISLECWLGYRKHLLLWSILGGALYAASDELHQHFVPGRSALIGDVALDTLGVLIGALLAAWIFRGLRGELENIDEDSTTDTPLPE